MVGKKLKAYAEEKGFKIKEGVAYGEYKGYLVTLSEGAGWISISFAAWLSDDTSRAVLNTMLDEKDLKKQYGINEYEVNEKAVSVNLIHNRKTISKLDGFADYMCSALESMKIPGAGVCTGCGLEVFDAMSSAVLIQGVVHSMHSSCAEKMSQDIENSHQEKKSTGSVLTGTIGAIVGGLLGSIPWAIAYYFGWFVGWLGLVIGFGAKKGYELFRGKETKIKAFVIILVTIIAVVVAEFVTIGISFYIELKNDSFFAGMNFTIAETYRMMFYFISEDPEIFRGIIADIVMGWVFAGLGIAGTIKQIFSETSIKTYMPVLLDKN